jgi:hypothetical protein
MINNDADAMTNLSLWQAHQLFVLTLTVRKHFEFGLGSDSHFNLKLLENCPLLI